MGIKDWFKRKKNVPENEQIVNNQEQLPFKTETNELEGREVYTWKELQDAIYNVEKLKEEIRLKEFLDGSLLEEQSKLRSSTVEKKEVLRTHIKGENSLFQFANANCAVCGDIKGRNEFTQNYINTANKPVCDKCGG